MEKTWSRRTFDRRRLWTECVHRRREGKGWRGGSVKETLSHFQSMNEVAAASRKSPAHDGGRRGEFASSVILQ